MNFWNVEMFVVLSAEVIQIKTSWYICLCIISYINVSTYYFYIDCCCTNNHTDKNYFNLSSCLYCYRLNYTKLLQKNYFV